VEIPFRVFIKRNPHLRNKSLNEQSFHYNDYILQQQLLLDHIIGGKASNTDFILLENGNFLLQEDGYQLIW